MTRLHRPADRDSCARDVDAEQAAGDGDPVEPVEVQEAKQRGRQTADCCSLLCPTGECIAPVRPPSNRPRFSTVSKSNQSGTGKSHGEAFNELRERDAIATR